jgi:hypothetical protein
MPLAGLEALFWLDNYWYAGSAPGPVAGVAQRSTLVTNISGFPVVLPLPYAGILAPGTSRFLPGAPATVLTALGGAPKVSGLLTLSDPVYPQVPDVTVYPTLGSNVVDIVGSGLPQDGTTGTGAGICGPGSLYRRTDTGQVYVQTNTLAEPIWASVNVTQP